MESMPYGVWGGTGPVRKKWSETMSKLQYTAPRSPSAAPRPTRRRARPCDKNTVDSCQ